MGNILRSKIRALKTQTEKMSQSCCARTTDCSDCCSSCYTMCLKTLSHCLKKGGDHAKGEHIQILLDCIAICQSCADLSARGSSACAKMCEVCSEACLAVQKAVKLWLP